MSDLDQSDHIYQRLAEMGWEYVQFDVDDFEWIKCDPEGDIIARGGDPRWDQDLEDAMA